MRALSVPEAGKLALVDIERPAIGPYQALVEIEVCGICSSTDWKVIRGQMPWAGPFPLLLGHEAVGRVVETGKRVKKFKVGDRVTRPVCPPFDGMGSAFGGFAAFGIVTDADAMSADGDDSLAGDYNAERQNVVPEGLDPVAASLAISLAETASGLIDLPNPRGRTIVVAGTGVAGLAFTRWCKLAGARVITLGRRASKLKLATQHGADATFNTTEEDWSKQLLEQFGQVDGLIEAIGDTAFAAQLLPLLRPHGFASAYGAPPDGQQFAGPWQGMDVREHLAYAWVADLICRSDIDPQSFISHVWDFDDVIDAFEDVRQGKVSKGFVRIAP